eukprot:SAG11_NODE_4108_length_2048_cov_1.508915_3_plen_161_part_00
MRCGCDAAPQLCAQVFSSHSLNYSTDLGGYSHHRPIVYLLTLGWVASGFEGQFACCTRIQVRAALCGDRVLNHRCEPLHDTHSYALILSCTFLSLSLLFYSSTLLLFHSFALLLFYSFALVLFCPSSLLLFYSSNLLLLRTGRRNCRCTFPWSSAVEARR